ncbi:baseplate J/gp47 family protein [Halococcus saccharolyticus]|uniref:Uncharacterized protein n=1 Tax=Halococcus saccharolyticus DSM 5350 TaxID=1227455 RepID=M0MU61_9EURY|nr:baseplate J/gp47 family protein [Halococcus saccharolyticus]EMA47985.1 hypothetical protein C449_00895 [Halococcus saccharolyticus DSM 5350]
MPLQIETADTTRKRLISLTSSEIADLTNFSQHSPEYILLDGEAEYLSDIQHGMLAAQLSGWLRFAGGPVTEDKLSTLFTEEQIARIDLPYLNSLMVDFDLDQKAIENGVVRDPGSPAIGEILVTVDSPDATVEAGTIVGTTPDAAGDYLAYRITDNGSPTGASTTVTLPITAWNREENEAAVGAEYNVGSNIIEYVPDEQEQDTSDILTVTNPNATYDGEGEEGNESLRQRTRNALVNRSGGGTTGGIEGQFISAFASIDDGDVEIIQHYDGTPTLSVSGSEIDTYDPETDPDISGTNGAPYGRVLVNAPDVTDSEFETFFDRDDVFPSTVYHRLLRATRRVVDVDLTLDGTDLDTTAIENTLAEYLASLTLGENVADGRITYEVMDAAPGDLADVDATLSLSDEPHTYTSGTAQYQLDSAAANVGDVTGTAGGSQTTFVAGTDYTTTDTTGDGAIDTIDWSIGGSNPDNGTTFTVDYTVADDVVIAQREVADPGNITVTVESGGS